MDILILDENVSKFTVEENLVLGGYTIYDKG